MIKELNRNNKNKILELSNTFPIIFDKFNIENDFENNPFTKYLYYELDNMIVGFINYNFMYGKIEIININVLEAYQNKKIASNLLETLINKEKDFINILLEVREDNIFAIKLYEKYGFEKIGIREKYYNKIDAIVMERK
ncbi:MAG: ribosomal protein S18-alanine N-acetyltransferase [Bacilli bacterium]